MWEYSVYDPFTHDFLLFRSKVEPYAFLAPQWAHSPVTPLQAIVSPLPGPWDGSPIPVYKGRSEIPKGALCSVDQYDRGIWVEEQSGGAEQATGNTSFVDVLLTGSTIIWLLDLASRIK